jgi:hypothetical protein
MLYIAARFACSDSTAWGHTKLLEFADGDGRWLWVMPTRSGAITVVYDSKVVMNHYL